MKFLRKMFVKNSMKVVGSVALFLSALVIVPTSFASGYQPKCPDELLK